MEKNNLEHIPSKEWVSLSLYQAHLLFILLKNRSEILSRDKIINEFWENHNIEISGHTLTQHIGILRKLFRNFDCDEFIITQPRVGFTLNPDISVMEIKENVEVRKDFMSINRKRMFIIAIVVTVVNIFLYTLNQFRHELTYKLKDDECIIESLQNFSLKDKNEIINNINLLLSKNNLKCQEDRLVLFDSYATPSRNGFKREMLSYCKLSSEKKLLVVTVISIGLLIIMIKINHKIIPTFILALLITASLIVWTIYNRQEKDFNCTGSILMTIEQMSGNDVQFNAALNLGISSSKATILIKGKMLENGRTSIIQRQLLLKDSYNGTNFKVERVNKGKLDMISDHAFALLLSELSESDENFYIYSHPIRDDIFLIGGPFSYLFTCKRYKS
jgi:DNA-binding winged helix-turn-helix (wHTH) protein